MKLFQDGTLSYLTVYIGDVLSNTNIDTGFYNNIKLSQEALQIKVKELSVLKYLNFRILQSTLGFSIDQTDHIMKLVNECFLAGKFWKIDTPFWIDPTNEK